MRVALSLAVVVTVTLLVACGSPSEPEREAGQERETVFDPLTEALDRAAGVEDTLREQSETLRRRVEESEQ
jgi:hypothetical protein